MPRALLIGHARRETDDRACNWLVAEGFETEWVFPYKGMPLPEDITGYDAVVIYGGPFDVNPPEAFPFLRDEAHAVERLIEAEVPLLGLCLGAQVIADVLGAPVGPHPEGAAEFGYYPVHPTKEGEALFGDGLTVLQSHWHGWFETPRDSVKLASSELFPEQAFRYGDRVFGFQFHPEASFETMSGWVERRGDRNFMPGACTPERQLADHARFDGALGDWFTRFLEGWAGGIPDRAPGA